MRGDAGAWTSSPRITRPALAPLFRGPDALFRGLVTLFPRVARGLALDPANRQNPSPSSPNEENDTRGLPRKTAVDPHSESHVRRRDPSIWSVLRSAFCLLPASFHATSDIPIPPLCTQWILVHTNTVLLPHLLLESYPRFWSFMALVLLSGRAASPGDLDLSFNQTGTVTTAFGGDDDFQKALAVQTDGKIVMVGGSVLAAVDHVDPAMVRYNLDGTLDSTFGGTGKIISTLGSNSFYAAAALQSDGKLIAAGLTSPQGVGVSDCPLQPRRWL